MTTILIDGNNVGRAAQYANAELRDGQGRPSGALYGFARTMNPIMRRALAESPGSLVKVVVAWDSATSWRKELLPSYKGVRHSADPDPDANAYYDQVPRIKNMLRAFGFAQFQADNFEADDIAGFFAGCADKLGFQLVLVSNDKDWHQLVSERVHQWRPLKAKDNPQEGYITPANFKEITGCDSADEYVSMKAITGDKDEVPGVFKVGDVTALKYLRSQLKTTAKTFEPIELWMQDPDGFERSKKLFDLRNVQNVAPHIKTDAGVFSRDAVIAQFQEYGFKSLIDNFDLWVEPFLKQVH